MTPLVETEKSDDLIIYHNSMDSQRTKRLRVSILKRKRASAIAYMESTVV